MKKILIFYPYNLRALDQETVAISLSKKYKVFFITIQESGEIHKYLKSKNIEAVSIFIGNKINSILFLQKLFLFYRFFLFFRKYKPDIVFSHLETCGLIAGILNIFCNFKNFYFRHNADSHLIDGNYKAKIVNFIVNTISKKIVCVSKSVFEYLLKIEKVPISKLIQIDYCYDFNNFKSTIDLNEIQTLKDKYKSDFLFLTVGRLVPLKRHNLIIDLIYKLSRNSDKKYTLLILGVGDQLELLKKKVHSLNLDKYVYFLGYVKHTYKYYYISDALIHFSSSEALGHVVIESGASKKPVIVCRDVGIFNELINDGDNGLIVEKINPVIDSYNKIIKCDKKNLKIMGENFYYTINNKFNINIVEQKYINLIEQ